jgi:hypothetical protein
MPDTAIPHLLSPDRAATTQADDEFDRYPFAQQIAATLKSRVDPASLVLGLYGIWGSGKSSVLNFIVTELEGSQVIPMRFNPWLFTGEEQLLLGFFTQLYEVLDKLGATASQEAREALAEHNRQFSERQAQYEQRATKEQADAYRASASLDNFRNKLNELLRSSGKRILVLIDDLDRLDKNEIQAMLRLVKLTGDFEYTTYLLAFDETMVARAVGERYPGGGLKAGRRFLEKIIQVPLHLPIIQQEVMSAYFEKKLRNCLTLLELEFSDADQQRVTSLLASSVLKGNVTPRDISRYLNMISVVLPMLRGEANMADLALIETVKIFYPSLYKAAASQQHLLTGETELNISSEQRKQYDQVFGEEASKLGDARPLFKALFPIIASVYRGPTWPFGANRRRNEDELFRTKSIASAYYFKRYFSYAVQPGEIPDISFAALLAHLKEKERPQARRLALQMIARSNDRELVRRLQPTQNTVGPEQAPAYIRLLIDISEAFTSAVTSIQFAQSLSLGSSLLLSYLLQIPEEAAKLALCERIIVDAAYSLSSSLLFNINRLQQWREEIGEELSNAVAFFTPERFHHLALLLIERVIRLAGSVPFYHKFESDSRFLFTIWQEAAGSTLTSTYLRNIFEQEPTELLSFLRYIAPTGFLNDELVYGNIDRETYQFLAKLGDVEYFYQLAQQLRGETPLMPYEPRRFHKPSDEERLHQFIYLHDNPEDDAVQEAVVVEE